MDCAEVAELLLPSELGTLDPDELAELDEHASACAACRARLDAAGEVAALLADWRAATDATFDEADVDGVLAGLAELQSARAERASARKSAREAAAPANRGSTVLLVLGGLVLLGAAVAAYVLTQKPPAPRADPLRDLAPQITDGERARDAACVIDVALLDEWKFAMPSDRRIASLVWARALARREGFGARCAFVRAILGASAGAVGGKAQASADPLRLAGELESAGLYAAATSESRRVADSAGGDDLRRRATLHVAAALLRQGKLDGATKVLDEIAPVASPPAEGDPAAPAPPRDFLGRLADILRARADEARQTRKTLAEYKGSRGKGADDVGGKMAVDALELGRALELLKGEDPAYTGPLVRGWVRLMRGEVEASLEGLEFVAREGKRYHRGLANLGLAEGAFLQGRYRSARHYIGRATEVAVENFDERLHEVLTLCRVERDLVDYGRPSFVTSDLESLPEGGALRGLVDAVLVPRVDPLIKARDSVTETWTAEPGSESELARIFERATGGAKPGTVTARKVLALDFESGPGALAPATPASEVSRAEGLSGRGARVSAAGRAAAARLVFEETVPEVETWVALAVRLEVPGGFAIWAKDASSGALFRWRTFSLPPGRWHRIAVPLGAFEPEKPTGADQSLLARSIVSIGLSMVSASEAPAAFVVDDLLVHHGEVPESADDRPETPGR